MESNNRQMRSAKVHLALLRDERDKIVGQERLYVTLAFVYGLTVYEIATLSGVPIPRVRAILAHGGPRGTSR